MRAASGVLAGLLAVALLAYFVLSADAPEPPPAASAPSGAKDAPLPVLPEAAPGEPRVADAGLAEPDPQVPSGLVAATPNAATVFGRVVDSKHAPVTGVEVSIVLADELSDRGTDLADPVAAFTTARDVSAADGSFRLAQPPADRLGLMLRRPGAGREFVTEIAVLPGITIDLGDIALADPRLVRGRVVDEAGKPVAGAEVLCSDSTSLMFAYFWRLQSPLGRRVQSGVIPDETWIQSFAGVLPQSVRARTAADGSFEASLLSPREDKIFVAARARDTTVAWDVFEIGKVTSPQPVALTLLRAAGTLAGHVTCADGAAVPPGCFVTASADANTSAGLYGRSAMVGPDGRFQVGGLLDGPHVVVVEAPGRVPSPPVTVPSGTLDAALVLGVPTLINVRVLRDGRPLDAFELLVRHESEWSTDRPGWDNRAAGPHAKGLLRLTGLPMGHVALQAFADGGCSAPLSVKLEDGHSSHDVELVVGATRTLHGFVVDLYSGRPIAGASVGADEGKHTDFARAEAITAADGGFTLGPLPAAAALRLKVASPGHLPAEQPVPAPSAEPIVVALVPRALVQIRIGSVLSEALRVGGMSLWDDEDDVRIVRVGYRDAHTHEIGPAGLFLDDLVPGPYRVGLASGGDVFADFAAVAGTLTVVDF